LSGGDPSNPLATPKWWLMLGRLLKLLSLMFVFATISNLFLGDAVAELLYGRETAGRKYVEEAIGMIYATVGGAALGAIVFWVWPARRKPQS
jgi:hypothetical protein